MKRNNKKGFTIVELVVVIAVIAILAAVLIPTFSNIIEKANISADTQLCRNMNTALSTAKADGREFNNMEDVLFTINEAGYVIENLNPTTEGYYYAWDSENDQIVFLNKKLNVHYPTDANVNPAKCWVTVKSETEANKVANHGYALYLEPKAESGMAIGFEVSVDAGVNNDFNLVLGATSTSKNIEIRGDYKELQVTAGHVEFNGVADKVTATVSDNTFVVNGLVKELKVENGKVEVKETGIIEKLDAPAGAIKSTSKGVILGDKDGEPIEGYTNPLEFTINNRSELESFRNAVNGGYNYAGKTVKLTADIDLDGIAWLPIGNFYRKTMSGNTEVKNTANGFAGTFDGQGHTIKNLSNNGFSVDGLAVGNNKSTLAGYTEVVYGFFGNVISGAKIMNLTVNAEIDMMKFKGMVGDSVGIIIGHAYGSITLSDCAVTGTVKGHDNVGGLVGRVTNVVGGDVATFSNCTNNAVVTANRKAGGILGYISGAGVAMTNCANKANVTSLPSSQDITTKDANGKEIDDGYYTAHGLVDCDNSKTAEKITFSGCSNTGTVTCQNASSVETPAIA